MRNDFLKQSTQSLTTLSFAHYFNDTYSMILPGLIPILIPLFGLDYFQAGLAAMLLIAIPAVIQPLLGHMGDSGKGKQVLVGGLLIVSTSTAFFGVAQSYAVFLLLCGIAGLGLAAYHPQATSFLSTGFGQQKGKALGVHGVGGSLGHFSGPILITILASTIIGWKFGLVLLVLPTSLVAALCWVTFHASDLGSPSSLKQAPLSIKKALTLPVIILSAVEALGLAVYRGLITFLPSFFVAEGSTILYAGLYTGVMLSAGIIAQPSGGLISDRVGRKNVILISLLALSPLVFVFAFLTSISHLFLLIALFLIGFCIFATFPVELAFSAELGEKNVGITVGIVSGISMSISAVAPPIIGFIIDKFGFFEAFYILGGFSLVGAVLAFFLPRS
ncbi:MAG: MFS transporter [Promethearchaeota archaeon]